MEKGEEWEALDQKQTEEAHAKAQADIQAAADYMKPILDNMVADMKAQHDAAQAQMEAEFDAQLTEMKAQAEA